MAEEVVESGEGAQRSREGNGGEGEVTRVTSGGIRGTIGLKVWAESVQVRYRGQTLCNGVIPENRGHRRRKD